MNKVDILGVKIDAITLPQALQQLESMAVDNQGHYAVTPNAEFIMQAQTDANFKEVINQADLALADGVGPIWASKYLAIPLTKISWLAKIQAFWQLLYSGALIFLSPKSIFSVIPERISGSDMVWEISKLANERNLSIFLVGAAPNVAQTTAQRLKILYPNLKIAGAITGPPQDPESEVISKIQELKPNFIFLAFPASEQVRWIDKYASQISGVMMGVGGAFDFIANAGAINAPAGDKSVAKRAPIFMQKRGLEWLYRYLTQPWRKKRIKTAVIDFTKAVFKHKLNSHSH